MNEVCEIKSNQVALLTKVKTGWDSARSWVFARPWVSKVMLAATMLTLSDYAMADNDIPTPDAGDDPTTGNNDFLDILVTLVKTKAGPLLIYGGAIFFIFLAIFDIYRGYKKYQDTEDFGKFKMSLVVGAILVIIGMSLLFLGQYILNQWVAN